MTLCSFSHFSLIKLHMHGTPVIYARESLRQNWSSFERSTVTYGITHTGCNISTGAWKAVMKKSYRSRLADSVFVMGEGSFMTVVFLTLYNKGVPSPCFLKLNPCYTFNSLAHYRMDKVGQEHFRFTVLLKESTKHSSEPVKSKVKSRLVLLTLLHKVCTDDYTEKMIFNHFHPCTNITTYRKV